ncbi:MAG TPA: cysteine desulfurase family protein [Bryobacteraceae bacterium]|nr:cysteine desulfurase family protein [Bryobacteraceae bacterium]
MERFYFDHNATTPVSPEVIQAVVPCFVEVYGNASSIHHFGQMAKQRLETARRQIAALIGCQQQEIVLVSGGTEADNLALLGIARRAPNSTKHVVTTTIEHPAVLSACEQLERQGVAVTYVRVGLSGVVDPDDIRRALRPSTVLVSVMHANNELGTIQPIREIANITREAAIYLHSDGVQAVGKIPANVNALGVDLYSLSGHKIYAPKGIGALFVRKGTRMDSVLFGGRQERERRPGTENVPGAVALGTAAECAGRDMETEAARIAALRDRLEEGILSLVAGTGANGARDRRTPNTANIYFEGIEGEALVIALDLRGFAVSTGAACSSGAVEPSHVLTAMGMSPERARASIRFSLGRSNTIEQVNALIGAVEESVKHLRKISPVVPVHA